MNDVSPDCMISLENVGVCYTRRRGMRGHAHYTFWALHDVSLEIRRGETLGIIGRNGAGKSTMLSLLAGIIRPDRGRVVNPGHLAALLSLQAGFDPFLSGRHNIILSGLLLGMTRREILARMDDIVELAGLGSFIEDPLRTYSSGMKVRLGFATAYHIDPDILLIDEVLGVGDAQFAETSSALLRRKIESKKTVVIVSHSAHMVEELCDRVVWIDQGRTRMDGTPEAVLQAYLEDCRVNPRQTV